MNGPLPARRPGGGGASTTTPRRGPCVKASNLAPGTTGPTLKEALQAWGITGIEEVAMSEGHYGPVAVMRFKNQEQAELMMMANGVEVLGSPMLLEFVPAAPAAPRGVFGKDRLSRAVPTATASAASNLLKITGLCSQGCHDREHQCGARDGLPKATQNQELVTCLRSYGVLGIAEVVLVRDNIGLVRFHSVREGDAAIEKADGATLQGQKLSLQAISQSDWRELEARTDPAVGGLRGEGRHYNGHEWDGGRSRNSSAGSQGSWCSMGSSSSTLGDPEASQPPRSSPHTVGLGGQKLARGTLPGSSQRCQQSGPNCGSSSGSLSRSHQASLRQGRSTPAAGRDDTYVPAAFRTQVVAARRRAAKASQDSWHAWADGWEGGHSDSPLGASGPRGVQGGRAGGWPAGWGSQAWGHGYGAKGGTSAWESRTAPY